MAYPVAARLQLTLAASTGATSQTAPWIGPLLALGARAARYSRKANDRQLVIVVSVPTRDYAAAVIGCGWILASEAPALAEPLETLREMKRGQALRAVNSQHVITGTFVSLNEDVQPPQAQFAGSKWRIDGIRAIAPIADISRDERAPRPVPESIEHMAQLDVAWDARLALPAADLAIVGTTTWLEEDFEATLGRVDDVRRPSKIRSILMPKTPRAATWFTSVYSSATLADNLPIPQAVKAVVLDGTSAIKHLTEIAAPVVICVLDRSTTDELAAETIVQIRNTRGISISLTRDLEWRPPSGIEGLGFTVPL